MQYKNYSHNGKIWIFILNHIKVTMISDIEQLLLLHLDFSEKWHPLVTTMVYDKYDAHEKKYMGGYLFYIYE